MIRAQAKGFSILEATVSMAVLSVLALGALALSSETQKGVARANSGSEIARTVSNIELLIKDPNQCGCNLKGKTLTTRNDGVLEVELSRLELVSKNCAAISTLVESGMRIGVAQIKSLSLRVHSVSVSGRGLGELEVLAQRDGQSEIEKTTLVPVQVDASRTKILGCGIQEPDAGAGLWVDYTPKSYTGPIGAQDLMTAQWSPNVDVVNGIAFPVAGSPYFTWGVYAQSPSEYCESQGFAGGASGACRAFHGSELMGEGTLFGNRHWQDQASQKVWAMACHLGGAEGATSRASGPNIMAPTKILCMGSAAVPQQTTQFFSITASAQGLPPGWTASAPVYNVTGTSDQMLTSISVPATGVARILQVQSQVRFDVNGTGGVGVYVGFTYQINGGAWQNCNNNHASGWAGSGTKPTLGTECMLRVAAGESAVIQLQAYTNSNPRFVTIDRLYLTTAPEPPLFRVLVQTGVQP